MINPTGYALGGNPLNSAPSLWSDNVEETTQQSENTSTYSDRSINPQGYNLGGAPTNIAPSLWGEDEKTTWTIEAEATVDDTTGTPDVDVTESSDPTTKTKTFFFEFSGLKGADGTNGVGITSIAKTGTSGLVDTYTITFTNGTTTTFTVTNGEKGDPGIGIQGDPGNGISDIQKTSTQGLVDTYTISFTDGTSTTFTVTNGAPGQSGSDGVGIQSITKTGTSGLVDTYTITFTNGTTTTFTVTNGSNGDDGVGISSIQKTVTSGLVDTYTITLTNGETDTFTVTNGSNGTTPVITITATEGGTPITVTKTGTDAAPNFDFALTGGGGGGTTVVANPSGAATDTLNKLQVESTIYSVPSGGSGSGVTIIANKSNFADVVTALTNGKYIGKLKVLINNANYYIRNIPAVKVSDMTTATLNITLGAGIIYFDASEFEDTRDGQNKWVEGHGMMRIVVPSNGGEYIFNGIMTIGHVEGNGLLFNMGRGFLSFAKSNARELYFTTGKASDFTINTTTSSISSIYAEMV
jgi:hypothetical protein